VASGKPASPASLACFQPEKIKGPPHLLRCYADIYPDFPSDWAAFPPPDKAQPPGGSDYTQFGATPGFGIGMMLVHYLLDWGDCVARITRRRSVPTIMKAWPTHRDRRLAHLFLTRYTWKGDEETPPFRLFLLSLPAFVGYTWDASLLLKWLDIVETAANDIAAPASLPPGEAAAAAGAWLAFAKTLFEAWSIERFPFDLSSLTSWYTEPTIALPVP